MKKLINITIYNNAMLAGIKSICKETLNFPSACRLPGINEAISSQNQIGWWALICGRWSQKWATAQQLYFNAIKCTSRQA